MPVRKVSAEEILRGKFLVMSANPALKGLKESRLRTARNPCSPQESDQSARDGIPSARGKIGPATP